MTQGMLCIVYSLVEMYEMLGVKEGHDLLGVWSTARHVPFVARIAPTHSYTNCFIS